MTLESWLTILAIILGPVLALAAQRWSERRREQRMRKLVVFKELMATRASSARTTPRHVEALNSIEMEFSGNGSDKKVYDAWRLYLDHLNTFPSNDQDPNFQNLATLWTDKSDDLLVDLLFQMSATLRFSFDKVELKKGIYVPKAHGDLELDQFLARKLLLEIVSGRRPVWTGIMTGDRPIKMEVTNLSDLQSPSESDKPGPGLDEITRQLAERRK